MEAIKKHIKSNQLLFSLVFFLLNFSITSANDGRYLSNGSIIYPINETNITLVKETLSFTVREGIANVDIYFEFNNTERVERKILVGFQAPSAVGDVPNYSSNFPQIKDFIVMHEDKILPYNLKAVDCEECELKEINKINFTNINQGVFVYLFEITFKPGINKIYHSYKFPASSSVFINEQYNYILKTGAKWKGNTIKQLTVNIDMESYQYFYVKDIFGKKAEWNFIGTGKKTKEAFKSHDNSINRMVRVLSGKLQIKVEDYQPKDNLEFGIIDDYSMATTLTKHYSDKTEDRFILYSLYMPLENYSNEELRILRNTIYARYGYDFKSQELKEYFSQFEWYIPDPNSKLEDIQLSEEEKKFIQRTIKEKN